MRLALALVGTCLLSTACHKADPVAGDDDVDAPGSAGSDAAVGSDFQMLIERGWTINSNTEAYECVRAQVPTEMWISGFHSLSPVGTHHSVLTISTTNTTLGNYDCDASSSLMDNQMLYAAGINTDDNIFPDGVAIHLAAGTYINLNLHLFNTTDFPITDTSGVYVKTMQQSAVVSEADMQFSGKLGFSIPANAAGDTTTVTAVANQCSVGHDFHVFTLWPHMHQIATHQKLTVTPSGSTVPVTLLDTDYSFMDQKNYPMTDTIIHAGDKITTTCDYVNTTGHEVDFGESSTDEMCFTGLYRYPAANNLLGCAEGAPI
jgi:Copper type II ascorbate-dependent monooxygenase, C-terminal domain